MSISIEKLCEDFEGCVGWPYASPGGTGKDCSACGIDCSGMFVRAYRLQGESIAHGSNTIWRKALSEKGELTGEGQLEKGMAVFKHKAEDTAKYPDGEGDFHHIGLVTSVVPLRIVHASSAIGMVTADTGIGGWTHWGRLSAAETADAEEATARVTAEHGSTGNVRAAPGGTVKERVPLGTEVTVTAREGSWARVRYTTEHTGYIRADFLKDVESVTEEDADE